MLLEVFIIGILFLLLRYFWCLPFKYWENKNVPHPSVSYLFGNIGDVVLFKKSLGQLYDEVYNKYSDFTFVGLYRFRTPCILIRDPELIKEVAVKSFHNFRDNDVHIDEEIDPLFARNPFSSKGQLWKERRAQSSQSFTVKKIKEMYPLMEGVSKNLIEYIKYNTIGCDTGVDGKDLCLKFTVDVVANCALGLEANSFVDSNSEYIRMIKKILNPTFANNIKFLLVMNYPAIAKLVKARIIDDDVGGYYTNLVSKTLEYRSKNNVHRGDFLDSMLELQQKIGSDKFTNIDITAHAMSFFTDGTDTSAIALSFTLYELGLHSDIQTTLRNDIEETIKKHGGQLTFDAVQDMKYLDAVINENLRKNAPAAFVSKLCIEKFTFEAPQKNGKPVSVEPGTPVIIPIHSIHHDPKYYPNPLTYDPTRFLGDNAENRVKCTFLPFSEGPRICVGQRFAIAQIKVAIVQIIRNFEVRVNKRTIVPYKIDPHNFLLAAEGGIWLDFFEYKKIKA